ncbi:hypothetical protein PHMEG_00034136 [Phytophthora megakarya]|uniref:Uncharacterized protein n=1 Tax=Phytophthora megakarya TaxID=4795 RepID=A0A225UT93_9STRA|nr:hypothetical protein PHMEG_00034136 [Phytophthora megakarya]
MRTTFKKSFAPEIAPRIVKRRLRLNPARIGRISACDNDSGSDSESDGSGGSDFDIDSHRRIFLAANEDVTPKVEKKSKNLDSRLLDRDLGHQDHNSKIHGNGFNRDRCSQLVNDQIYMVIHVIYMGNIPSQIQVFAKSTSMPDLKSP